jgi:hypothetical protein
VDTGRRRSPAGTPVPQRQGYIGEDRFTDCAKYAQDILDGTYGTYKVSDRWDAAFDWNNETCDEVIFAFPGQPATPTGTIRATSTVVGALQASDC